MQNLKYLLGDKKFMAKVIGGVAALIFLIVIIMVVVGIVNKKTTYSEMETNLITAAQKYMKEHTEMYPTEDNPVFSLDGSTLVTEKYIKDFNKALKDNCSATIEVHFKNNDYQYKPILSCEKYETTELFDKILADNPITTTGNGLYDMNEMVVFRGDDVKNYFRFNSLIWRIVKMDPDGAIYLILENPKDAQNDVWDDRYNTSEESNRGINDYDVSRAIDILDKTFESKFTSLKSYLLPMDICVGKRSEEEKNNDGSIECANQLETQKLISLLPLSDFINASTDKSCTSAADRGCANYNYLKNKTGKWWTLTADSSRGTKVYGVNYTGIIAADYANSKKYLRYVIALDGTNIYESGNGTLENPYVVK